MLRGHEDLDVFTHNTNGTYALYMLYPVRMLNPFGDDAIDHGVISNALFGGLRVRLARSYYRDPEDGRIRVLSSPTYVEFLPLLQRAFPEAKYIHLRRDPLDAVGSLLRFFHKNGEATVRQMYRDSRYHGAAWAASRSLSHAFHSLRWARVRERGYVGTRPPGFQESARLPLLEFLCWYYTRVEKQIAAALENVPADRVYDVSYERLVTNFKPEFGRLAEFMGVSASDEYLSKMATAVKTGGLGRAAKAFLPHELDLVSRLLHTPEAVVQAHGA
jgi:hypothetical protein